MRAGYLAARQSCFSSVYLLPNRVKTSQLQQTNRAKKVARGPAGVQARGGSGRAGEGDTQKPGLGVAARLRELAEERWCGLLNTRVYSANALVF